jgi:uncharacterized membrane protein
VSSDRRSPTPIALPSRDDPLIGSLSEPIGGPAGARAVPAPRWWGPARVALAVACAVLALGVIADGRCHADGWAERDRDTWANLCYSDVPFLYRERGFADHLLPYRDTPLEYPVVTGAVMQGSAFLARAAAAATDPALEDRRMIESVRFYDITALLMAGFALVVVFATGRTVRRRPWDGLLVAASPVLLLSATINWDLMAAAFVALAILAWTRERSVLTGIFIGLGTAAKLYPVLLLGPMLLLVFRSSRRKEDLGRFASTVGAAAVTWAAVNIPVYLWAPDGWLASYTFHWDREISFGSPWYAIHIWQPDLLPNQVDPLVFGAGLIFLVAIAALVIAAPEPPRLAQLAFLAVAAFVLVNKVWSPQFALWLLPLAVLARPRWRDVLIWQVTEVAYFVAVWWYLGGIISAELYAAAIAVHVAGLVFLMAMVTRDVLRPAHDPVRPYADALAPVRPTPATRRPYADPIAPGEPAHDQR